MDQDRGARLRRLHWHCRRALLEQAAVNGKLQDAEERWLTLQSALEEL